MIKKKRYISEQNEQHHLICTEKELNLHILICTQRFPGRITRNCYTLFSLGRNWASLVAQLVKNLPAMQETLVQFLGLEVPLEKRQANHSSILGFPGASVGKKICLQCGRPGSIPGLGKSPGGGHGNPIQYSCLEIPHGEISLVCYSPWGLKESDITERPRTTEQGVSTLCDMGKQVKCLLFHLHSSQYSIFIINIYIYSSFKISHGHNFQLLLHLRQMK